MVKGIVSISIYIKIALGENNNLTHFISMLLFEEKAFNRGLVFDICQKTYIKNAIIAGEALYPSFSYLLFFYILIL